MHTQTQKRIFSFILSLAALFVIAAPALVSIGTANSAAEFGLGAAKEINVSGEEVTDTTAKTMIAKIINIVLGFVGIISVVIIIYSGLKWMTARGNEDQVAEAKKMLGQAVIGLVIIFLAYVITNFIVAQLKAGIGEQ